MRILSLVENTAENGCRAKHGLSLYIETPQHRLLFDLGPDDTLFRNAETMDVDLTEVDTVIISHGHFDHGGALRRFLEVNGKAKVYVQAGAFEPHFNRVGPVKIPIGLDPALSDHPRVITVQGDRRIDEELLLFTVPEQKLLRSPMNDVLWGERRRDDFLHEQNLMIFGKSNVLVMGCGHAGIANILKKAEPYAPGVCVGGFHLFDPVLRRTAPKLLLDDIAGVLNASPDIMFYTCHCTGKKAYKYLGERVPKLSYLACGRSLTVPEAEGAQQ